MFRLSLLGSPNLTGPDGRALRAVLAQPKRFALLAYLSLAPRGGCRRRDALLPLFWPEADADGARHALRQSLYFLRRSFDCNVLQSHGEQIGIETTVLRCDVLEFEEALDANDPASAVSWYRGDLLEAFHVPDAPDFEHWVDRERARLKTRAAEAGWKLAKNAEAQGNWREALRWGRQAHTLAPFEEASLRRLLGLLERAGERMEALQLYGAFTRMLATEYELTPSAETQSVAAQLRAGSRASRFSGTSGAPSTGEKLPTAMSTTTPDPSHQALELPSEEAHGQHGRKERSHRLSLVAGVVLLALLALLLVVTRLPGSERRPTARAPVLPDPDSAQASAGHRT